MITLPGVSSPVNYAGDREVNFFDAVSYETLFCTAILRSPALTSYETLLDVVSCVLRILFFGTGMFALSGAYVLQDSSRRILLRLRSPALAIALTGNVQG